LIQIFLCFQRILKFKKTMKPIPITILAGSDHAPGPLPESGPALHSLAAYKGAEVTLHGRPIIELLIKQIKLSGGFDPITIAGPREVYEPLRLDARIVDTNGAIGQNLQAAIDDHQARYDDKTPIAMLAYDVLLSAEQLAELRRHYELDQPCAVWVPFVQMPEKKDRLGAFAWKPSYPLRLEKGAEVINVLPGHLAVFYPATLRLPIFYRILNLVYQTRNHSVSVRRRVLVPAILGTLLKADLRGLGRLKLPLLTFSVIANGLRIAGQLMRRELTIPVLEKSIGGIFLHRDSALRGPGRGIRHPIINILNLAEDVDTQEEAEGLEGTAPINPSARV
jgi:hypothetical protein